MTRLAAVILSAGSSSRMGRPKALLEMRGSTFVEAIVDELCAASIAEIVVVLGAAHEEIARVITRVSKERDTGCSVRIAVNPLWETSRLSSVITGIDALEHSRCTGAVIWPVDHPRVTASSLRPMVQAFERTGRIILPVFNGRRGHPIVLPRTVFDDVKSASAEEGLRAVIRAHAHDVLEVPVDEEGVLINIDTPEEYRRYLNE